MTTAETVSADEAESTRMVGARNHAELLRAVARTTQSRAAECLGVHASTISRRLDDMKDVCLLLAAFGLQLAPLDAMVVARLEIEALEGLAFKYLEGRQYERLKGL
ncbi:transcriptional regulator [Pandoraea iniqua]|uniref:CII family transcriptional regulator n=1 Tax=Pandoraea iniqua TaxID=2508288 RepID=UPI001240191D|nr:CII family transcriptional regulator [Pandoraea iniqua]VVE59515.1 transcriptional regulator [Pandoraea iniqua]